MQKTGLADLIYSYQSNWFYALQVYGCIYMATGKSQIIISGKSGKEKNTRSYEFYELILNRNVN